MFKIDGLKAFNENVRMIDESVKRIKLCGIEIDRESQGVIYKFVCDKTIPDEVQSKIVDYCFGVTPKSFTTAEARFTKIVADGELVALRVYNYIKNNYPSLLFDFSLADVKVEKFDGEFKYTLKMIPASCEYCRKNGTLGKINADLDRNFCDNFAGALEEKQQTVTVDLSGTVVSENDLQTISKRTITVSDVFVIDDPEAPVTALYIEDAVSQGEVTLCGRITGIRKKETVNKKPFYIIDFTDKTAKTSGLYFTRKNTADKIAKLSEGDDIIIRGKLDYYKDKLSLTINKINLCKFPENFVPEKKAASAVPLEYRLIKPQPAEGVKETSMFDETAELPECLTSGHFVVFDLETTGTDTENDEITEIGAVRIENGRITETFQTLVKPKQHISARITELTGIDDELVKDAPSFAEVLPDFYKFASGAILVGHNAADFDYKFIKNRSKALDYFFTNRLIDTYPLARETVLGLTNYKLNTVADRFNITFHHHRALNDAFATAEVFIELIKIKKSLPNF